MFLAKILVLLDIPGSNRVAPLGVMSPTIYIMYKKEKAKMDGKNSIRHSLYFSTILIGYEILICFVTIHIYLL